MTLTLELPDVPEDLVRRLDERLRETGQDRATYLRRLLERDLKAPTLDQILAPFRVQVAESGLSDEQLDRLFDEAREEVAGERGPDE